MNIRRPLPKYVSPLRGASEDVVGRLGMGVIALSMVAVTLRTTNGAEATFPTSLDRWSNVTAGEEIKLVFRLPRDVREGEIIGWSVAVDSAVIIRRETKVRNDGNGNPRLSLSFCLPEGEPRMIVPVTIRISFDDRDVLAKQLWLYPSDPFRNPVPSFKADQLVLFDPSQTTAARWREASLQFHEQPNAEALSDLDDGVLVIGEGVSFREYRGLSRLIGQAARRGVNVLCLAPSEGTFVLADADDTRNHEIASLLLARADVLSSFDKHLDFLDWRGPSPVNGTTIQFASSSQQMSATFVLDGTGWPWLAAEYRGGGRVVIACFHCIEHWDSGPAPRHALWHLLAETARPSVHQTAKSD